MTSSSISIDCGGCAQNQGHLTYLGEANGHPWGPCLAQELYLLLSDAGELAVWCYEKGRNAAGEILGFMAPEEILSACCRKACCLFMGKSKLKCADLRVSDNQLFV